MTCAGSSNSTDLVLAINGADERLQLALGRLAAPGRAELLAAQEWTVPGQAARFLAPGLRHMLDALDLKAADISRIACVSGPGSFTGLRMSLALAEGLAAGTGAQLAGIGHLRLLALDAARTFCAGGSGAVLALAWSRRGQVYAQAFRGLEELTPPSVARVEDLKEFLAALPRPLALLGGGLRRNLPAFEALAEADPGLTLLPPSFDAPKPENLLELAAGAAYGPGPLLPVYLRASDAEDNLAAIAAGRGLSEAEALAILAKGSRILS